MKVVAAVRVAHCGAVRSPSQETWRRATVPRSDGGNPRVENDFAVRFHGCKTVWRTARLGLSYGKWTRSVLAIVLFFGFLATSTAAQNQVSVDRADANTAAPCSPIAQNVGEGVTQTVNCIIQGFTPEQMTELVRAANEGATAPLTRQIEDLRGRLGVTEGAALAMLRSLGQADVPVERLPQALADLAQQHKELLERLRAAYANWAKWHILWVDDNPRNNEFERQAFEEHGIEFSLATSTGEARRILDRSKFDAIISDMGRPPDSEAGYTLLGAVRGSGSRVPYFIYAGSRDPHHVTEALSRGAQGSTNLATELIEMVLTSLAATAQAAPARR